MNNCVCGVPVRFVLLHEATETAARQWSAPMVTVGRTVRVKGQTVTVTEKFEPHTCPESQEAQSIERQRWAMQADLPTRKAQMQALIEEALTRDCPTCKVEAGVMCQNLSARRQSRKIDTVWPHPTRMAAGS